MTTRAQKKTNIALRVAIVRRGLTQRAIAQRAGIPEVELSHYVRGRKAPSDKERDKLAKVLGVPANELFDVPSDHDASSEAVR